MILNMPDEMFWYMNYSCNAWHFSVFCKSVKRTYLWLRKYNTKRDTHPASASVLEEGRQPTWTPSEAPDPERGPQAERETNT